jgi:hypothetical protein
MDPLASAALAWGLSSAGGDVIQQAHVEAMSMLAGRQRLGANAIGSWVFTAESCGGTYPDEKGTPAEQRWWNDNTKQCVLANPMGLDFCEQTGSLDWEPDSETGMPICKVTPGYCNSKGMSYVDGDCETTFSTYLLEQLVGTTLARGYQYVWENPEEALEGAVGAAAAAAEQAGKPFAPTTEAIDYVANKVGISPYTSAAKQAASKYVGEGWQRTGAVGLRYAGKAIKELNKYQAMGFGYTANAIRHITTCAETDCLGVGDKIVDAYEAVDAGGRKVVAGIKVLPGGEMAVDGVEKLGREIGFPEARQWIAGPGARELKGFGQGMLEGFKMAGGWATDGMGYATDYGQQSASMLADVFGTGASEASQAAVMGQKAFFGGISEGVKEAAEVKQVAQEAASAAKAVAEAAADGARSVGRSIASAFGF